METSLHSANIDRAETMDNNAKDELPRPTRTTESSSHPAKTSKGEITTLSASKDAEVSENGSQPFITVSKRLYGRDSERQRLFSLFQQKMMSNDERKNESGSKVASSLVLLTGPSGTGKTRLASQLRPRIEAQKGLFLSAKFDQVNSADSFRMFLSTFSALFEAKNDVTQPDVLRNAVRLTLGDETKLLAQYIPIQEDSPHQATTSHKFDTQMALKSRETAKRFRTVYCRFLKCICSQCHVPIVLFLDDLQWADRDSLDLLLSMLSFEGGIKGLFVIGACRGNEVSAKDYLSEILRVYEDVHGGLVEEIRLGNLDRAAVEKLIFDSLAVPRLETARQLANRIFECSRGNIFATLQLLQDISWMSSGEASKDQSVDLEAKFPSSIGAGAESSDDLLEVMQFRIRKLPEQEQDVLTMAAFLGGRFNLEEVRYVADATINDNIFNAIELAMVIHEDDSNTLFRFVHDKIQQAFYERIPPERRAVLHLGISKKLCEATNSTGSRPLMLIVAQLDRATSAIVDTNDRIEAAELYLAASRVASNASSFEAASRYACASLELLPQGSWESQYELALTAFTTAAELLFVVGKFDLTTTFVDEVIQKGRSLEDRLPAHFIRIYLLGAQYRLSDALDEGVGLLKLLGEPMPSRPGIIGILLEYRRTAALLRKYEDSDVLSAKGNPDWKRSAVMKTFLLMFAYAFFTDPELSIIMSFRMVNTSLDTGVTSESAPAFAMYGMILVIAFRRLEEGKRWADLALELMRAHPSRSWTARVQAAVYGGVHANFRPHRETIEPLRQGYKDGLVSGDIEFAMFCFHLMSVAQFYASVPLPRAADELKTGLQEMLAYNQRHMASLQVVYLTYVHSLMGTPIDSTVVDEELLDEGRVLSAALLEKNNPVMLSCFGLKASTCFILNMYDEAETWLKKLYAHAHLRGTTPAYRAFLEFMGGLNNLAMIHRHSMTGWKRRKRIRSANRSLRFLKDGARFSPENLKHRVMVLEAELAGLSRGKLTMDLETKYDEAARWACDQSLFCDEAVIYEFKSMALLQDRRLQDGLRALKLARDCYERWGATRKVQQLDQSSIVS